MYRVMIRNNLNGTEIGYDDVTGAVMLNGKVPRTTQLANGYFKATVTMVRYKNPKKVLGARKRKKALSKSIKRFWFSTNYKRD